MAYLRGVGGTHDAFGLSLALLERVLVLKLGSHIVDGYSRESLGRVLLCFMIEIVCRW